MEVTVIEAQGMPKKPIITIRAGTGLRHVEMSLNKPFNVSARGMDDGRINVGLYEQLGTQTIHDADESESTCNVPIRAPDGTCSQVKLRIRRGPPATGPNFKTSTVGVENYLSHHKLEDRMQNLFELVLKKQPENPYRCMIAELQRVKVEEQARAPKTPIAPAGPPPKHGRPTPHGRNGKPASEAETMAELMRQQTDGMLTGDILLNPARERSRSGHAKALSNLELAHEVMRLVIRNIVAGLASQSSSLGNTRANARSVAVEHAKNIKIAPHVIVMLLKDAQTRLQAESLGLMGGGHTQSDDIFVKSHIYDPVGLAEHKALTQFVMRAAVKKAYSSL